MSFCFTKGLMMQCGKDAMRECENDKMIE